MSLTKKTLQIDKNVPLPKAKSGGRINTQHLYDALDIMEIGDSVVFAVDGMRRGKEPTSKEGNTFHTIARRTYKFKISQRLSEDRQTFRYWRIG
jgi:hypothetical protein